MKSRWIGRWIVAVSVLHTIFGLVVFGEDLMQIAREGFWNSIGEDARAGAVAWFMLSGFLMTALGVAVDSLERAATPGSLRATGIVLLLTTLLGIVLMPASGFWLMLPSAVAMLWRRNLPLTREAA